MRLGLQARRKVTQSIVPLALAGLISAGLLAGCAVSPTSGPDVVVRAFLSGWANRDWAVMRHLVDRPPADFERLNILALSNLEVTKARYVAAPVIETADTASVRVTEDLTLSAIGRWAVHTTLHLESRAGHWLVQWSPATIDPFLRSGDQLARETTWAQRARILGAGGAPLTTEVPMVIVGVEGDYVKDSSSLTKALTAAGAPVQAVRVALTAAKANPTYFEPVFTVTKARYLDLRPTLYPIPGTVFQTMSMRAAITPGLQAHLVGSVGPITGQELHELGAPYDASSVVGQTGLEQVYERQLAGTPGATITVVRANGTTRATLAVLAAKPGRALETSINPAVQRAAEAALAGVPKSAALVAVKASSGQVLASVSNPSSDGFDQALDGAFAPGSSFKTITSTALIDDGLTPGSPASCPTSIEVGGEVFHNAEGDALVENLAQAFTESCNTAFIGLATSHLSASSLPANAAFYDIGTTPSMGLAAFGGEVPRPADEAALAATAIGQGQVLVSPLDMAMVAAAIDTGTVREPRLVVGAPDDRAPTHALSKEVVNDLHEMMAEVVSKGTAANEGLPPGTYAKTGTAEYGTGNPPPTDAWLVGFNRDIAFAVVVVDGGYGGPTDGPIVARFLRALGRTS